MNENIETKELEVTEQTQQAEQPAPKRVKMNRIRNLALASILAAGIVGAPYAAASTANAASSSTTTTTDTTLNTSSASSSDSTTKDETVYVFNNADGSVKNTLVSDWLKNGDKAATLNDASSLTDITNTEGDQAYTKNGEDVTWAANGSDIYYQGSTTQQAPVTMKITYTLDGQEVTPDQIAGKSGKVTIRFDYTNNSTSVQNGMTTYTPFVVITGLILNTDNFTNVEVANGKMLNDGEHVTVAGYALPGMQDDLNVSKDVLDVPDYFEITADATDFKMDTTATVVSNDLFTKDIDTEINTDTIESDLNSLQDAMTQLLDGSTDLTSGLNQLAAGTATLSEGLNTAEVGTAKLESASDQVDDGLDQLKNGTDTTTGLQDAVDSLGDDDDTTNTTLLGGVNLINAGLGSLQTQLDKNLDTATTAIDSRLVAGLDTAIAGIGKDSDTYPANATLLGLANSATYADTKASSEATEAATDLGKLYKDYATGKLTLTPTQASELSEAVNKLNNNPTDPTQATDGATYWAAAGQNLNTNIAEKLKALRGSATDTSGSLYALKNGLTTLSSSLKAGKTSVDTGIGQLETGVSTLKKSLILMRDGGQINDKTSKGLSGAVEALGDVSTSDTLIYGESAISGGLGSLFSGLTSAKSGSDTIEANMETAAVGSATLSDGLRQFDEQGVQKLVDAYNDDVAGLTDHIKAAKNAAMAYNNFSGKSSGVSGSVKFIYETDGINNN